MTNGLERTIVLEAVKCQDESRELDLPIDSNQTVEVALQEKERGQRVELDLAVRCLADLIVPHSMAVIRHGGVRERLSMETLLGLDDLYEYPWVKRLLNISIRTKLM